MVTWSITDICGCRYLRIVDGRVGYLQVTVTYVPRCSRHFPCVVASEAVLAWPLNVPMKLLYGKRPVNKDLLVTLDSRSCSCCSSCNRRLAVDCVTLCEESLHTNQLLCLAAGHTVYAVAQLLHVLHSCSLCKSCEISPTIVMKVANRIPASRCYFQDCQESLCDAQAAESPEKRPSKATTLC